MVKKNKEKEVKYSLDANGEFIIQNYNLAKPFANFFPGISGKYGIPMWVFYVNRGQGICSFGTKDKDHAILEFFPANKAWQIVSSQGFRTFLKLKSGNKTVFYEPFQNSALNAAFNLTNRMFISSSGLRLEEDNLSLGIKTEVEYFNIPNDNYAGLVRILSLRNLSRSNKTIELLDGLPQIVPFGTGNLFLKKLSRTIEAWMKVSNLEKGVPFYKLDVDPADRPEVIHITEGNFYLAFHYDGKKADIIRPITDAQSIFGPVMDFSYPVKFLDSSGFNASQMQPPNSRTPCGFSPLSIRLGAGKEKKLYCVTGYMRSIEALNANIKKITASGYLAQKSDENKKIIGELEENIDTQSSSAQFNLYAKQTYLDNVIRGGYPVVFPSQEGKSVFYLYSRKHGDLERDYNKFQLQPTYYSQGNGNYRDINQNRRLDAWFNPETKDGNLINFFNLIQADGFNPLVIKGISFKLKDETALKERLIRALPEKHIEFIAGFLKEKFSPGELILFLEENGIRPKVSYDELLGLIIPACQKIQEAEHGEGFWIDHWHYNLDLLESYLNLYPEELKELVFVKKAFTFFDNTETVKPRSEKYLLHEGSVKQLHSVSPDSAKREMIRKRHHQPHLVRMQYGNGQIYSTTLLNKLLLLLANKLASLDPFGVGVEMEADKPNWFDALNGLPGLLGSSSCETFELKRLIILINGCLKTAGINKVYITEEIHGLLWALNQIISEKDYIFWDKSHSLKEDFRLKVRFGFSGNETQVEAAELNGVLANCLKKISSGIKKAKDDNASNYYAYFINEVTEYEAIKEHFVKPLKFIQKRLPFFLEAQMHALRIADNIQGAKSIYKSTKTSQLFDKKLKMYKVTAPLKDMPEEIGRCRVFTPGWLENESIWLHMEYKYLLEVLKQGLYKEFYDEFRNCLIPFQDPASYGRSILENSSFLVSSAFPDKNLHGNGFVARLSGSTAEFLQIWLIMNAGRKPFFLNEKNELNLAFEPVLAGWLFDKKGLYSFNFLSKIRVTYYNPKRKNTFGPGAVKPNKIILTDENEKYINIPGGTIPSPYALNIRALRCKRIDIHLS